MAANLEEWNDERSKWKVGRLLQSSVEFFGAQLRILRATTTARGDRSPCQMELLPVTNRCSRHHLTLPRASIPSVTSGPRPPPVAPHPHATRVACICRPTEGAAENYQMAGCRRLFQPRKRNKRSRVVVDVDVLPNLLTNSCRLTRSGRTKGRRSDGDR